MKVSKAVYKELHEIKTIFGVLASLGARCGVKIEKVNMDDNHSCVMYGMEMRTPRAEKLLLAIAPRYMSREEVNLYRERLNYKRRRARAFALSKKQVTSDDDPQT